MCACSITRTRERLDASVCNREPGDRGRAGWQSVLAAGAALLLGSAVAGAQTSRSGWYGGVEIGAALPEAIGIRGHSDDVPTNCDGHFPDIVLDGRTLPLPLDHPDCAGEAEGWMSRFDIDSGPLIGLHAGYAWGSYRFEAEISHRRHGGNRSDSTITAGDKEAEFVHGVEGVRDIRAGALFGNVYRDFGGESDGLRPYVGAGVGWVGISLAYSSAYHRNPDSQVLRVLGRHPGAAGTLSAQDAVLSDRLKGHQFIAGLDRPLAGGLVLGVKVRHLAVWEDFADGGPPDVLRSHEPTVAPGGRRVTNTITTGDLGYWGISLTLKHWF